MRAHAEWKVMTHIARARRPTSPSTRSRISAAALLVKVMARISLGFAWSERTRWAMRRVSAAVLPEPAPARIRSGPSPWRTVSRCGWLRPSSRVSMPSAGAVVVTPPRIEREAGVAGVERHGAQKSADGEAAGADALENAVLTLRRAAARGRPRNDACV